MPPIDDTRAATASLAPSTEGAQAPTAPGASAGHPLAEPPSNVSTLPPVSAKRWAVFDTSGIWGAGDTPRQAFYEAKGFFEDKLPPRDPVLTQTICGFQVARIGPALLDIVIAEGPGYVLFAHVGDELVPADEPFANGPPKVVRIRA